MATDQQSSSDGATSSGVGPFYDDKHVHYVSTLGDRLDSPTSYEGAVTEHLRMSGVYWSLGAISLLRGEDDVDSLMGLSRPPDGAARRSIVDFVFDCHDPSTGGFGGNCTRGGGGRGPIPHDGHLLYTLSALQILAMADALDDARLDGDGVVRFVSGLQNGDGSFSGDRWGEVDTRFSYCALSCLALLGRLPLPSWARGGDEGEGRTAGGGGEDEEPPVIDTEAAVRYILSCRNFDGGFGCVPGAESHAGQVFCCVGALSIARSLHLLCEPPGSDPDAGADLLSWWLAERQCDSGGLNGRPEKQADVCYSWWILSALSIMGRVGWIDTGMLGGFILSCQDEDDGGIADRPFDMPDVYHTFFGLCGLSFIGHLDKIGEGNGRSYRKIDPVFALPSDVVERLGLSAQVFRDAKGEVDPRLHMHTSIENNSDPR